MRWYQSVWYPLIFVVVALSTSTRVAIATQKPENASVRLVVVFSIDQCRADYLTRFTQYYLPARSGKRVGGFLFLRATGAYYCDAHFAHVPTTTGPGHATLLTGSAPCLHGVISNVWYDREKGKKRYCVEDDSVQTVGGGNLPVSPQALLVTTVGDELKMATKGKAKVVGIAYKDRAAILMAGHAADTVIWLDENTGRWVSSTYYARNSELPKWVEKLNAEKYIDRFFGRRWEPILSHDAYSYSRSAFSSQPTPTSTSVIPKPFSYELKGDGKIGVAFYRAFISSGFGNNYIFETAKRAIRAEELGQDETPDLLVVNLSTNDYIGHLYGPNSPEVMDISVRTDRLLSDFLNFLQMSIPGGLDRIVIAVIADHGVASIPEQVQQLARGYAGRVSPQTVMNAVEAALDKTFGEAQWVLTLTEAHLYLDRAVMVEKGAKPEEVEQVAAQAAAQVQGIYCAFTRTQILNGKLPAWEWTKLVFNGYHPRLSGDILVFEEPHWLFSPFPGGTGHNSPWTYDTHVPLVLRGPGIKNGRYLRRVTTMDLAPTLCQILGIGYPSGCLGKPLVEALGEK